MMEETKEMDQQELLANSTTAATSSATPLVTPAKGLFLRVKRRRDEAPLSTLVVTSERAEKRAAYQDLRQRMEGANLTAAETNAAAAAAAQQEATNAASAAAATPTSSSTAAASPTSSGGSFRRPVSSPTHQRVFRLLTSTAAPKEAHGTEAAIVARIQAMRARVGANAATAGSLVHPSVKPSAEDTHVERLTKSQISTAEKRQLRLASNREKLSALHQQHLVPRAPQLVHDTDELQLQIVDIALPGSSAAPVAAKFKTTFEPAPVTVAEAKRAQKRAERAQRTAIEQPTIVPTTVDAFEATKQFSQAMTQIKRMPGNREQMDAYKALMEDYLSIVTPTQSAPEATTAVAASTAPSSSTSSAATATSSTPAISSPSTNKLAPKILKRRKNKITSSTVHMEGDDVPTNQPISFQSTPDAPLPERIFAPEPTFTAGGLPYEPHLLVPATGTSLHRAYPATGEATGSTSILPRDSDDEDGEIVYDVYYLPDDEPMTQHAVDTPETRTGPIPPTDTSNSVSPILVTDEDYKSQYAGASSAYVVLKDGLMSWVGGGDELVNEGDYTSEMDDPTADDDDDCQLSDYPEDEDESERSCLDEVDDRDYHEARYQTNPKAAEMWSLPSAFHGHHQEHGLVHLKKTAQRQHGYLQEAPDAEDDDEEDDDPITKEVRRSMRAADRDLDHSSSDDEDCAHYQPQYRGEEDDEEYTDTIQDDMEEDDDSHE